MTSKEIISRLRQYQKQEEISETELSMRLGIRQTTVWNWLNKNVEPKGEYRAKLERFLRRNSK